MTAQVPADTETASMSANKEYQIKAAFIYNFIIFAEWEESDDGDQKELRLKLINRNQNCLQKK